MSDSTARIEPLDALRGVAAEIVVFHHSLAVLPSMWAPYLHLATSSTLVRVLAFTPLHILWAGPEAVILFFVLSGFVLSIPFWRGKTVTWHEFAAKRIVRLYPTYVVAVGIGAIAMSSIAGRPTGVAAWVADYWDRPISWQMLLDHVLMLGRARYNIIDVPVWSLAVEMQVSLLFPFLMMAMFKLRWWSVPAALLLSAAARHLGLPESIHFLWLFVLGAELARNRNRIEAVLRTTPWALQIALTLAAMSIFVLKWWLPILSFADFIATAVGAGGLIIACANFKSLRPVLQWHPLQWLGRVSYSLYLIHFIVLYALVCGLSPILPLWTLLAATPVLALVAAHFLYRFVEAPSIALSKSHLLVVLPRRLRRRLS